MNLQQLQRNVLKRMLNTNVSGGDDDDGDEHGAGTGGAGQDWHGNWKVLIFDKPCQDILSPLLNVADLRKLGITLHLPLKSSRERVPDVPAVYFVRPTADNIDRICADASRGLYDSMYLNFTTSIPRAMIERLAHTTLKAGPSSVNRITRVLDQFSEFVTLEPQLFSLNHVDSYVTLNDPKTDEQKLMTYIDSVVDSLFSVVVTTGVVPIIRAQPQGPAQMVAEKLSERLHAHLLSHNNLFTQAAAAAAATDKGGVDGRAAFKRPVLLLFDRNLDWTVPLAHSWTYQALVHDLLGLKNNRVTCEVTPSATEDADAEASKSKSKRKTYDLAMTDTFWAVNAGKPFPKVAEAVTAKLAAYQADVNAVNAQSGATSFSFTDGEDGDGSGKSATASLANAISSLPALRKRKTALDMHMNIATSILKLLKQREIDGYFAVEEQIIVGSKVDMATFRELLAPSGKGTPQDKLRLLMIYTLCTDVPEAEQAELEALLTESFAGRPDIMFKPALKYLQTHKFLIKIKNGSQAGGGVSQEQVSASSSSSSFMGLANIVMGKSADLLSGVRNLLPVNKDLPLTRAVASLVQNVESKDTEGYVYLDPKQMKKGGGRVQRVTAPFDDAIVFVLGGGNYIEHQNIQDYARQHSTTMSTKSIVYGCTQIFSADEFVSQLTALGNDGSNSGNGKGKAISGGMALD